NDLTLRIDHDDRVFVTDHRRGDHMTRSIGEPHCGDAFAPAALNRELAGCRPLAEPPGGDNEQIALLGDHFRRDNPVACRKPDSADTGGRTSHWPDIAFVEVNGLSALGHE